MRTPKQKERQRQEYREKGKYAKVNPCDACGKSAGVDYCSHPLTDTPGWSCAALCLCRKCWEATKDMTDFNEFLSFKKI